MKKEKTEKKNKKKLLIVSTISLFTVLGGTLAYFTTSTNITNLFRTALYQNEIVERFESPKDWTPGTTTNKTVSVKNTGNIPIAVRAKYTERWVSSNGNELPLTDSNNNNAAIIHFNEGWTKDEDGYYYYGSKTNKTKVLTNESTNSFINSITFNEEIRADLKETITNNGQTIKYTSSGNGYDNATYTLIITIDTIQYDLANNIW